jgi:hypothetical protein
MCNSFHLQDLYNCYYFLCSYGMVAEKTLQFQMVSIIDFGCKKDHPGSPPLAHDPGGAHAPHTTEATPLLHIDYKVMLCQ